MTETAELQTSAVATTPPTTKAAMIRAVLAEQHMRFVIAPVADRFHVRLDDLQHILHQAGYPDRDAMKACVARLEASGTDEPMTSTAAAAGTAGGRTLVELEVAKVNPDPDNPRENLTGIDELADSIVEVGLLQPIVVRRGAAGRYFVVAGHRRLAAVKRLKWAKVPVIVGGEMRPDHILAAMLIENGQRADLDPIEEARGLHRLKAQLECNEADLATRVGRSLSHVNGRLLLLQLSPEDQAAVRAGHLGITAASQKARVDSGRVRNGAVGRPGVGHLSIAHELASRAQARCTRLEHTRGKGKGVGGVACGECWESVIRADEREHLQELISKTGTCSTCGTTGLAPKDQA